MSDRANKSQNEVPQPSPVDILVVTALTEEHQVVTSVLEELASFKGQLSGYVGLYEYTTPSGELYQIAVASAHQMGAHKMGAFVAPLLRDIDPECVALIGIAAAVDPGAVNIGDVPFSSHVLAYDDIAIEKATMTFRTEGYPTDPEMRKAASAMCSSPRSYSAWQEACRNAMQSISNSLNILRKSKITMQHLDHAPHLLIEISAGGPFLIRDADFRDSLRGSKSAPSVELQGDRIQVSSPVHTKLISAEMESHGFMSAAAENHVPACVLKGISDVGDESKQKLERESGGFFRAYACVNAILALLHILHQHPRKQIEATATVDDESRNAVQKPGEGSDEGVGAKSPRTQEVQGDGGVRRSDPFEGAIDAGDFELADKIRNDTLSTIAPGLEKKCKDIYMCHSMAMKGHIPALAKLKEYSEDEDVQSVVNVHLARYYYIRAGDPVQSKRHLVLASKGKDSTWSTFAVISLSENLLSSGRTSDAIAVIEGHVKRESLDEDDLASSYKQLAKCYEKNGDTLMGIVALNKAATLGEDRFSVSYTASTVHGLNDFVIWSYGLILRSDPESHSVLNNLGVAYSRAKLKTLSVEKYRKAMSLGNSLAISNFAAGLLDNGYVAEAEEALRKIEDLLEAEHAGAIVERVKKAKKDDLAQVDQIKAKGEQIAEFMITFSDMYHSDAPEACRLAGQWKAGSEYVIDEEDGKTILKSTSSHLEWRATLDIAGCGAKGQVEIRKYRYGDYSWVRDGATLMYLEGDDVLRVLVCGEDRCSIERWSRMSNGDQDQDQGQGIA